MAFREDISLGPLSILDGTFSTLYNRIDRLAVAAHPLHSKFHDAVMEIVGLPITTTQSNGGKVAGFYFDQDNFVPMDQMGDGVTEMVALIVELCTEKDKIFVLEEPETNLHPSGLKALLSMVRTSSKSNQFIIATHSNIVVRELSGGQDGKVFRVHRNGKTITSPSNVEEVEKSTNAHTELLRELGYEFADFGIYDAWLFLEEASAETVIRDVLIPFFAPELQGKLRTFSAGGIAALEPSVADFQRLMVFIHLQPVYQNRLWVRVDGDKIGNEIVAKMRLNFPYFSNQELNIFTQTQFEYYYPEIFQEKAKTAIEMTNNKHKRSQKLDLLKEVLAWSKACATDAKVAWVTSAAEPIALLKSIASKIENTK